MDILQNVLPLIQCNNKIGTKCYRINEYIFYVVFDSFVVYIALSRICVLNAIQLLFLFDDFIFVHTYTHQKINVSDKSGPFFRVVFSFS